MFYDKSQQSRVFVIASRFWPSLKFSGKAGAYPRYLTIMFVTVIHIQPSPILVCKAWYYLEVVFNKHQELTK